MKELVFDIGANKGWETWDSTLCTYHTKRPWQTNYRVLCVEPTPGLCEELTEKFKDDDVEILQAAVTDDDFPTIDFWVSKSHTASTCSKDRIQNRHLLMHLGHCYDPGQTTQIQVPTTRIDKLVEEYGRPIFIKIDVEGYEYKVLNTFAENYCPISFEWSEQEQDNLFKSMERCQQLGYTKFWVTFGNIGICNSLNDLTREFVECDYWRLQLPWVSQLIEPFTKARSYEKTIKWLHNHCKQQRVIHTKQGQLVTDPLWGQIYAE